MDLTRTVVCKLAPTPEQASDIDATLEAFAGAGDFAADTARRIGSTNKVKVQQAGYKAIRETFGLSANLAIRAIARACAALKVPAKMHSAFAPTSIDYDARILSFHEWNWTFGLTLLSGRVKIATQLGERQKAMLGGRKPTAAQLVKRRDGGYFLHVQLTDPAPPEIEVKDVIGVDMGVVNLATTDDGETFKGDGVENARRRYNRIRKTCQRTGTKRAKRKLAKVRKKESRFRANENHVISKRIVEKAKGTNSAIAVEDLAGIGERTTVAKPQRSRMKGWAFYQLRQFIAYKALLAGIPVIPVDPRDTSRTCPECGHCEKKNRKSRDEFECRRCGHAAPADRVGARNIRRKAIQNWVPVMTPNVGAVETSLETGGGHWQLLRQAAGL
jgi:IS605 OrfB family transposase